MSLLAMTAELRRERLDAAEGTGSLLMCRGVEVAYDQVQVLFGVDIEIRPGECVALLGTNGAGKSTLLKAISGVVEPMGGAIFFEGRDITHSDGVATTKAGVIQVPGGKAGLPDADRRRASARGRLALPRRPEVPRRRRRRRPAEIFPVSPSVATELAGQPVRAASSRCSPWAWRSSPSRSCS